MLGNLYVTKFLNKEMENMTDNTALLQRKALALFNFLSNKHLNDKKIGELSLQDILEIVAFMLKEESHGTN